MEKRRGAKAQVWISAVLYTLIMVVAVFIILEAGTPIINGLKERTAFSRAKDAMQAIDQYVIQIASEGPGSQRTIPLDISTGRIYSKNGSLTWEMQTDSKVVEPRTGSRSGNILVVSTTANQLASLYESEDYCYYTLENSRIVARISIFGNVSKKLENCSPEVNTSTLIRSIVLKETGSETSGVFKILIANDSTSSFGNGFTVPVEKGDGLASAAVLLYVNSTKYDYVLQVGLDSTSDFLEIKLLSVKVKGNG
ncbi:MAG: hypothetical protein QW471_01985 [Candidatus Woesearchaeota archaeon]